MPPSVVWHAEYDVSRCLHPPGLVSVQAVYQQTPSDVTCMHCTIPGLAACIIKRSCVDGLCHLEDTKCCSDLPIAGCLQQPGKWSMAIQVKHMQKWAEGATSGTCSAPFRPMASLTRSVKEGPCPCQSSPWISSALPSTYARWPHRSRQMHAGEMKVVVQANHGNCICRSALVRPTGLPGTLLQAQMCPTEDCNAA